MKILINRESWQLIFGRFSKPHIKPYCTFTAYKIAWFSVYIHRTIKGGMSKVNCVFLFLACIGLIDMACQAWTSGEFKIIQTILGLIF